MKAPAAVWATLTAALFYIGLRWFERAMVFIPAKTMYAHPGTVGLPFEQLWLTASDGARLRAWWIPGPSAEAPVILCLHGNGGNISMRTDKIKIFHDAGAAQLWFDYRGYGESSGSPNEPGLYRDALAAWAWLERVKTVPAARLVLYGESLGCAVAVELATHVPAAGLIVESGFTSIKDMARVVLPWFPVRLAKLRFDSLAKLPRVAIPTLILHSPEDDIIPYEQARRNYAASGAAKKTLVQLKGSHNHGFLDTGPAYGAAIRDFLVSLSKEAKK